MLKVKIDQMSKNDLRSSDPKMVKDTQLKMIHLPFHLNVIFTLQVRQFIEMVSGSDSLDTASCRLQQSDTMHAEDSNSSNGVVGSNNSNSGGNYGLNVPQGQHHSETHKTTQSLVWS